MDGTRQSRLLAPVLIAVLLALMVPGVMYADLPPRDPRRATRTTTARRDRRWWGSSN